MLFCRLLIFFKINFLKNSFRNTIRMSNSLDPDLGPNCLPKLSAADTGRQRVKANFYINLDHVDVITYNLRLHPSNLASQQGHWEAAVGIHHGNISVLK